MGPTVLLERGTPRAACGEWLLRQRWKMQGLLKGESTPEARREESLSSFQHGITRQRREAMLHDRVAANAVLLSVQAAW